MQDLEEREFLRRVVLTGISVESGSGALTFPGRRQNRFWSTPERAAARPYFLSAMIDLLGEWETVAIWRRRGTWPTRSEIDGQKIGKRVERQILEGIGIPLGSSDVVEFDRSERDKLITVMFTTTIFGWSVGEDLYVIPDHGRQIIEISHHDVVHLAVSANDDIDRYVTLMSEQEYELPNDAPDGTFKKQSWMNQQPLDRIGKSVMSTSEISVDTLITVQQAIEIIDGIALEARAVEGSLTDAIGVRLAENVVADRDSPAFEKALMDGFAVRCDEVANVPVELSVAGTIAAGASIAKTTPGNSAIAIMTGAPFPAEVGFDGLVPVEDTTRVSNEIVRIHRPASPGRFIATRGSDCKAGEVVLTRGTLIGPAQIAVAGSVGATTLSVFEPPHIGVLTTGDEIVPIDQTPGPTQLRNTNSAMLAALLRKMGATVDELGIVGDDPKLIRDAIESALANHDVLFVTGGMSMGEFDFVPRVLKEIGAQLHITKLRIKPGKPFVFASLAPSPSYSGERVGVRGSSRDVREKPLTLTLSPEYEGEGTRTKYIFGLPGNPVSGFVCTLRLASRFIARLGGGPPDAFEQWSIGTLATALEANGPREFYQPAVLQSDGTVQPLAWKGSADIFTLARANALLVRAQSEPAIETGTTVRVLHVLT